MERILKVDLNPVRNAIASEELISLAKELGRSGIFPFENYKVVMREGIITTILTPEQNSISKLNKKNKRHSKDERKGFIRKNIK
jgi:hypothetical protein